MPRLKLAHLREQGQNMLLFPLDGGRIHHKTNTQKAELLAELEARAHAAGLAGTAALVWDYGGRTHTYGPKQWQGFLRSISTQMVLMNVNQEISW